MPRIVPLGITGDNPNRAGEFCSDVFGWKLHNWEGLIEYWLINTGVSEMPGSDSGLAKQQDSCDANVNAIGIASLDDYIRKVTDAGGKILQSKMAIPGVGWWAIFQDPEGNVFGLVEDDPSVK